MYESRPSKYCVVDLEEVVLIVNRSNVERRGYSLEELLTPSVTLWRKPWSKGSAGSRPRFFLASSHSVMVGLGANLQLK
jgi:hypothetical protein